MPEQPGPAERLDVDARFLLANERTLLAWVRTGLTLLALGGATAQFGTDVRHRRGLAVFLISIAMLVTAAGFQRYRAADVALRRGRLPGTGASPAVLVALVLLASAGMLVAVARG